MTLLFKNFSVEIFDGFFGARKIFLDDFISFEANKNLTELSEATLKIAKISGITPLDRIKILGISENFEQIIFDGFVREMEADLYFLKLSLVDFRQILERKFFLSEKKNFRDIRGFLNAILNEWRTVTGESIIFEIRGDVNFASGKIFEANAGESFFGVLNTLTENVAVWNFDIDEKKIIITEQLGVEHSEIFSFSPYHADSSIMEVSASITENYASRYYLTEQKRMEKLEILDEEKYWVLVSTSDEDKKKWFGVDRNFEIKIFSSSLAVGDTLRLEIIWENYTEAVVESSWSDNSGGIVGDYISFFGKAFVLSENIVIEGGKYEKIVEIGTKIVRKKSLTEMILRVAR